MVYDLTYINELLPDLPEEHKEFWLKDTHLVLDKFCQESPRALSLGLLCFYCVLMT